MSREDFRVESGAPAIVVEGLSKRYRIGLEDDRPDTLAGVLRGWFTSPLSNYRRLRGLSRFEDENGDDVIWALREISFSVERGEMLGVIGRNGAGKSTLLKILSRITHPTSGRAVLAGRVSSLLEVGTGFHPELTGRENIYLNGTILGMSKREVDGKLNEIIEFSGVERFIDTPVKRYSSGMKVRLAFSVAAHLEPEILLVDEVLAVGDAEFRKRSLGKMENVAGEGRTVMFVSHNMAMMSSLCSRAILLEDGRIAIDGPVEDVIRTYLERTQGEHTRTSLGERNDRTGGEIFRFRSIEFFDPKTGNRLEALMGGRQVLVRIRGEAQHSLSRGVSIAFAFYNRNGSFLCACSNDAVDRELEVERGENVFHCLIERLPLSGGRYYLNLMARQGDRILDWVKNASSVEVETGDFYGTGRVPSPGTQGVLIEFDWPSRGEIAARRGQGQSEP